MAELAEAQSGVIAWAQLRELGVPGSTICGWTAAGWLQEVLPSVYAFGHRELRWEGRLVAAVLYGGEGAAVSHRAAAALFGVRQTLSPRIDITLPRGRRRHPEIRWHRSSLAPEDVTVRDGVRVTSLPRVMLDMAALLDANSLTRAMVRADQQGLLDAEAIRAAYRRCPGHRGGSRLIRALDAYLPQLVHTRSGVEVDACRLLVAAGLPEPVINGRVETDIGELEVDLLWRRARVAVEIDTFDTHGDPLAFETDRRRDQALIRAGVRSLRTTDVAIKNRPDEFVASVTHLLATSP